MLEVLKKEPVLVETLVDLNPRINIRREILRSTEVKVSNVRKIHLRKNQFRCVCP